MYNLCQPASVGHNMSAQAIRSEIYNEEQNEIKEMNQENTIRTEKANISRTYTLILPGISCLEISRHNDMF